MKTTYEERGIKFAKVLARLFEDCYYLSDFKEVIKAYNNCHKRKLRYSNGVSRIVIIRSDYVIKFDYKNRERAWVNGRAGNCETEAQVYDMAVRAGMAYLLARPTLLHINGLTCTVMPRVNGVGNDDKYWQKTCTDYEREWLYDNINDLHYNNVGYRRGKVCVIDYAWDATMW